MLELITNGIMTSSGMDISESFRPEDLGKTDFFDFVGSAGGGGNAPAGTDVNGRDVVSGSGNDGTTATATSAADRPPGSGGGGGGGGSSGPSSASSAASSVGSSRNPGDGGVNGSGAVVVVGSGNGSGSTSNSQPLQGFDQFWGPDKDANRLDQTMFDDINRYCWIQQQSSSTSSGQPQQQQQQGGAGAVSNTVADTDGQIYTLTVLNGAPEPWVLRKDPSAHEPPPPASNLDLDTILGGFPGYVKTECFSYDDSGFGTDHHGKEDQQLLNQQQQQQHQQHLHQQVQQIPVTSTNIVLSNSLMDPNSVIAYQNNNNNDWQMSDHNVISEHETTSESLLRCALQGKGYTKGTAVQLQNGGITVIPAGQIKEEDLRRLVYTGDADTMAYADSTLANPLFEDSALHSPGSNHNPAAINNPQHVPHPSVGDLGSGVVVDDMFLTLDSTFTEDYEKLKRIASEVQQFCTDNNNYTEIIVETAAAINNQHPQHQNPALLSSNNGTSGLVISSVAGSGTGHHAISTTTSSDVVTTTSTTKVKAPRSSKKYKRSLNNNSANSTTTNNNNSIANNNNNTNMSNLNTTQQQQQPSILSSTTPNPSSNPSPTGHCNGQRKERSLHYCSICSKGFKDKYSVNVHIRTHTGEKPFACSLCGKSFRQKAHLAKHYQTHMAQKNPSGSVGKSSKQSRAAAEQAAAAAAAAAAALQQSSAVPPPPPPTTAGQSQVAAGVAGTPILLNTATIVASR